MRKPWSRPKLVVLVRGTPQEAVLQICKHPTREQIAPESANNQYCFWEPMGACQHCHDSSHT